MLENIYFRYFNEGPKTHQVVIAVTHFKNLFPLGLFRVVWSMKNTENLGNDGVSPFNSMKRIFFSKYILLIVIST